MTESQAPVMEKPAGAGARKWLAGLSALARRAAENPVILKELRGRMRGRRAFIFLTLYLVLISLFILVIYSVVAAQASVSRSDPGFRQEIGKVIFSSVVLFEFLMIGFIGPALTAGAITSERERQTFDLLRTTLLSARAMVFGKLGSACLYLFLLLLTALPIEALAFLLGGVGLEELLVSSLMLVVNTVFFCALGLLCSSFTTRTLTATVSSYAIILLSVLALGLTVFLLGFFMTTTLGSSGGSQASEYLFELVLWIMSASNPFSAAIVSETFLIQDQSLFIVKVPLAGTTAYLISPWILHVALYVILTAVMILFSVQLVKRPDR